MPHVLVPLCIATAILWFLSMLRCLTYHQVTRMAEQSRRTPSPEGELPAFSVLVLAHNQCEALKRNLPLILNQIYPAFEVIVIDQQSNDNTKEYLEQMEEDYPQLRHTIMPSTSRDISPQRLAITLGVKASMHPWFVLTQADCAPLSHLWLKRLGEALLGHRSAQMVLGHTRYVPAKGYAERRMRFFRLWQETLVIALTPHFGAYRADGCNMVYNKELFLSHQGFAAHSNLLMGAVEIMVNRQSTRDNTAICLHPEAVMEQSFPAARYWQQDRLFFQETRKYFTHTFWYRLHYARTVILHWLLLIAFVSTVALSLWHQAYPLLGFTLLLWLEHFLWQGYWFGKSVRALDDRSIAYVRTAWFLHLIPWWDLQAWLRHQFTNAQTFRKKFI